MVYSYNGNDSAVRRNTDICNSMNIKNSTLSKLSQARISIITSCEILFYKVLGQTKLKRGYKNENPSFLSQGKGSSRPKGIMRAFTKMMEMRCPCKWYIHLSELIKF